MPVPDTPACRAPSAKTPFPAEDFERASAEFWDGFQTFQRRSAEFFTRRLEEDRAFVVKAMGCKDPSEFLTLQRGWLSDMGEAYAAHGRSLVSLAFPEGEANRADHDQA